MRVVNKEEFLKLPAGTLYQQYTPHAFDPPQIKDDTVGGDDFCIELLFDEPVRMNMFIDDEPQPVELETHVIRDADRMNVHQQYAIWEPDDIQTLINRLTRLLPTKEPAT